MAKKGNTQAALDFSGFMPILILTIGSLLVLLVTNTIIIISNPENVRITSVIRSALYIEGGSGMEGGPPFPYGNKRKEPSYVDVYRNKLIIYPGNKVLPVRDLELAGNAFEALVEEISAKREDEYIILLVRPRAAKVARQLRKAIKARGIDIGCELFEDTRPVYYGKIESTE